MPLTIPDEWLAESGFDERELRVEIACRLYAAGKLSLPQATRWAGLTRTELEEQLLLRDLPLVYIGRDYLEQELASLSRLGDNRAVASGQASRAVQRSPSAD